MKIFNDRADSEIIGLVIILAITILGIGIITLFGLPALNGMQDIANIKNVEQAFTVLDSRASRTALGEASMQVTELSLGGGTLSVESNSSNGYILVELKNGSGVISNLPNITMGKIVYRLGDREVSYEGGGVWSKTSSGSVMLSPPEFHYNGITLTIPVINISGNYSIGGKGKVSLNIGKVGEGTHIVYPTASGQNINPLPDNVTDVKITIKSEYYDAWADYFESASMVSVSSYPNEKKVVVRLETPPIFTNFTYGALASDSIRLTKGTIDSYNSSLGDYITTQNENGSIRANEEIIIEKFGLVKGSALSSEKIKCGTQCGKITWDAVSPFIEDGIQVLSGIKIIEPVERLTLKDSTSTVKNKINEYKISNDNLNPSSGGCIAGNILTSSDCTISSGNYYLTKFELATGQHLTFNTTPGEIEIAVNSTVSALLNQGSNITIIGNNPVKLYLEKSMKIDQNAEVNRGNDEKSSLFQVVSSYNSDDAVDFRNNCFFIGFVYAPNSEFHLKNNANVYGALIGEEFEIDNNMVFHYDQALQNINMDLGTGTTVLYLHLTRNDIGVNIS